VSVVDPNYEGELTGAVSITKKILTVDVVDVSIIQGDPIPSFVLTYSGFAGTEDSSVLAQQPTANTTASASSGPGEYEIMTSGGSDRNYAFDYKTGVLTISKVTGLSENDDFKIEIFPNPAVDKIRINSPEWTCVKIYDLIGRNVVDSGSFGEEISLQGCQSGIYVLQIQFVDGNIFEQRIMVNK
jgi:hypothetical protein